MSSSSLVRCCLHALAPFADRLEHAQTVHLLDPPPDPHPALWAVIAQLVRPLPPHLHDCHLHLAHPNLPLLQNITDSPRFSLISLLSLPHCTRLRDDDVASLRTLHRLHALDLRGCLISSYALIALARGLAPSGAGPWRLRLLSLHGCPNIDDDLLPALPKFPLLSAVDLRFTRCTKHAVDSLSRHGFRPSDNNSLFHPAPLSVALCSLEKMALSASIALYSCPPESLFRLHIDQLDSQPRPNKRTASATEGTSPPLATCAPEPSASPPVDQPISNAASFYASSSTTRPRNILPLSAQAVRTSDPLAVARLPPPWKTFGVVAEHSKRPSRTTAHSLDGALKVDHARLHKRGSDAVARMVHQFTTKRPKIESEFALAKTRAKASRNPFTACSPQSVFAGSTTTTCDKPRPPTHEGELDLKLRACRSLFSEGNSKPLKPITSLKPPVLPKELLPSLPKPRIELKQTRLSFG